MFLRTIPALVLLLAVQPARAEEGLLDRLFGHAETTPANPFASNYASGPPSREAVREARERAARGARRDPDAGPVPPGRIPD